MELWHEVCDGELRQIDLFMGGFEAGGEVDRPLAGNIIRYFDVTNLATFEICGHNVISVDVAKMRLGSSQLCWAGHIPFSTLQVTNAVWKDETVARADRLDNAAGNIVFASTQVRLVNCVEFTTTARDLKLVLE